MIPEVVPVENDGVVGDGKYAIPAMKPVAEISSHAPSRHSFGMSPLRICKKTKHHGSGDWNPQIKKQTRDECGDGIGTTDEVCPIPFFTKTHVVVLHDGSLEVCLP